MKGKVDNDKILKECEEFHFQGSDMKQSPSEPMKNIPNKIYLQVNDEDERPEDFDGCTGITWFVDKLNDNDIEYRLVEPPSEEEKETLERKLSKAMIEYLRSHPDKPFIASSRREFSYHGLAKEIEDETPDGIESLASLIILSLDRVSRGKDKLRELEKSENQEETFTKRELEIAYCTGLLNQEELDVDKLQIQLTSAKFPQVLKFIQSLRKPIIKFHD
jgi:Leucine-rich repeat (LRR) protein